jgi:hypothetical protein
MKELRLYGMARCAETWQTARLGAGAKITGIIAGVPADVARGMSRAWSKHMTTAGLKGVKARADYTKLYLKEVGRP